jgi:hypothetical protein
MIARTYFSYCASFLPSCLKDSVVTIRLPFCFSGGTDVLTIFLSTLAILLLLELDDILFGFGLNNRQLARVQEHSKIPLVEAEATRVARTTVVHSIVVVPAVAVSITLRGAATDMSNFAKYSLTGLYIPFFAMFVCRVDEIFTSGASTFDMAKQVLLAFGASVLSCMFALVYTLSQTG